MGTEKWVWKSSSIWMCGGEQTGTGGAVRAPISSWGRWHDPGRKEGSVRQRETKGKNIKIKEREAKILGLMADTSLAERSGPRDRVNLRLQVQGRQTSSCSS